MKTIKLCAETWPDASMSDMRNVCRQDYNMTNLLNPTGDVRAYALGTREMLRVTRHSLANAGRLSRERYARTVDYVGNIRGEVVVPCALSTIWREQP